MIKTVACDDCGCEERILLCRACYLELTKKIGVLKKENEELAFANSCLRIVTAGQGKKDGNVRGEK